MIPLVAARRKVDRTRRNPPAGGLPLHRPRAIQWFEEEEEDEDDEEDRQQLQDRPQHEGDTEQSSSMYDPGSPSSLVRYHQAPSEPSGERTQREEPRPQGAADRSSDPDPAPQSEPQLHPTPRRRGRPPKNSVAPTAASTATVKNELQSLPRRRGRPPKIPIGTAAEPDPPPRRRGRPPKNPSVVAAAVAAADPEPTPRRRGRPPKVHTVVIAAGALESEPTSQLQSPQRRRGRPPKNPAVSAAAEPMTPSSAPLAVVAAVPVQRRRGRPPKNASATAAATELQSPPPSLAAGPGPRRRGRPPKNPAAAAGPKPPPSGSLSPSSAASVPPTEPGQRRRGRPPKNPTAASFGAAEPEMSRAAEHMNDNEEAPAAEHNNMLGGSKEEAANEPADSDSFDSNDDAAQDSSQDDSKDEDFHEDEAVEADSSAEDEEEEGVGNAAPSRRPPSIKRPNFRDGDDDDAEPSSEDESFRFSKSPDRGRPAQPANGGSYDVDYDSCNEDSLPNSHRQGSRRWSGSKRPATERDGDLVDSSDYEKSSTAKNGLAAPRKRSGSDESTSAAAAAAAAAASKPKGRRSSRGGKARAINIARPNAKRGSERGTTKRSKARLSVDSDADMPVAGRRARHRRRSVQFDEDKDSFVPSEPSDDESQDLLEVSDGDGIAVGVVRDGDVGDAEGSSDDDAKIPAGHRQMPFPRAGTLDDADDSSTDGRVVTQMDSPPRVQRCPNTVDAITQEDLPSKHVCFVAPDGSSRYCFALETLRQIAVTSSNPKHNEDGSLAFLQPPHFRSALSSDLEDRIAGLFGRSALEINGPYYDKRQITADGISFNGPPSELSTAYESSSFVERVRRFVRSIMGTRDLYACPLCYAAAYKRMGQGCRTAANINVSDSYSSRFLEDPISILGSLDNHDFGIAATFCFHAANEVKKHLLADHGVNSRKVRGNALYDAFAIRKQDGLLQRFIRNSSYRDATQGDTHRYWLQGNNFEFVHLMELVDKVKEDRLIELHPDRYEEKEVEDAEYVLNRGREFFDSFRRDAQALWDVISGPFQYDDEDMKDFLADEGSGDEAEDERMGHLQFNQELVQEEMIADADLVARYEQMDQDSVEEDCDDEDSNAPAEQLPSSSSEDEDGWMEEKRKSLESKRFRNRKSASQKRNVERLKRSNSSPSSDDVVVEVDSPYVMNAKRHSLEDSESDDEAGRKRVFPANQISEGQATKRRRSIQDDVDE